MFWNPKVGYNFNYYLFLFIFHDTILALALGQFLVEQNGFIHRGFGVVRHSAGHPPTSVILRKFLYFLI